MKLLCSVSSPTRGTKAERKLIIKMLKKGVHPKAIFHDLYLKRKSGSYSQIDLVVATPQGLVVIEVKDYSGWLFGSERQRREAVRNGENPAIVASHVADVQSRNKDCPRPVITWFPRFFRIFRWRKWIRF